MIVLDFGRPVIDHSPFKTNTSHPAAAGFSALKISRSRGDVVPIARPRPTTDAVNHQAVPGVAQAPGYGREPFRLGRNVLVGKKRIVGIAFHVGPGEVARDPKNPA